MIERPWTKEIKTRYWVELEIPYDLIRKSSNEERALETISEDLNNLFKDHYMWQGFSSNVNFETKVVCAFCSHEYTEEMYNEKDVERKHPLCAWCGKGEIEYMIKKLEMAK